jgi:hypothetical protein
VADPTPLPKIYIFCQGCQPEWHPIEALSEDGVFLAGHLCSHHGFVAHDMGLDLNGWNREKYERYYPGGFELVWVEKPREHEGLMAAYAKHTAMTNEEYAAKYAPLAALKAEQDAARAAKEPLNG